MHMREDGDIRMRRTVGDSGWLQPNPDKTVNQELEIHRKDRAVHIAKGPRTEPQEEARTRPVRFCGWESLGAKTPNAECVINSNPDPRAQSKLVENRRRLQNNS